MGFFTVAIIVLISLKMNQYSISFLEQQLQKRVAYNYQWGQFQNNLWDHYTSFIYSTPVWDHFVAHLKKAHHQLQVDKRALFNYAANRWFNYWSAYGVEKIFNESPQVTPVANTKDPNKDFFINHIPFDHKTTVFPKGFGHTITHAQQNPKLLIEWLYKNQSKEQRFHLKNRLFVVVYQKQGNHWQVKAQLSLLKVAIENYLQNFKENQLYNFTFNPNQTTLSDIIFVKSE